MQLNQNDAAYLAGLLDGEGCIGARVTKEGYVHTALEVCMTNSSPLRWAHKVTGVGSIYEINEKRPKRKLPTKWVVSDTLQIADILKQLIPFLKVKKFEAQAFLVYASLKQSKSNGKRDFPDCERKVANMICNLKKIEERNVKG
jgi:hypothetical protein